MKTQDFIKQIAFCLSAPGLLWSTASFAQAPASTPVSTSVHISGSCSKCDLSRRVMPGLSLQGANFAGSDFSHSNLSGAKLNQSRLNNTSFHKAYLMRVSGVNVNLKNAELRGTTLSEASLIASDFTQADLRKADLTGSDFTRSDFSRAKLISTDAMGTVFVGANFYKSNLGRGDFTHADFSNSRFIGTKFGDANVENANFSGANFSGASMYKITGLTQGQLDGACGSEDTHLPAGFTLKTCPKSAGLLAQTSTVSQTPLTPNALNLPRQTTLFVNRPDPSINQIAPPSHHNLDLEEAIELIDKSIRDLPLGSPTRARLSQAHKRLEKVRRATDN